MALPENSTDTDVFGQQLQEKKQSKGKRIWKGLGLTVLLGAAASAAFLTFTQQGRQVKDLGGKGISGLVTAQTNPDLIFNESGDHVNILLIGRDVNWKIGKVFDPTTGKYRSFQVHDENAKARSDTMIVVALDKSKNTIRMVSLPRDAIVRLPENEAGVRRTKLNAAHAHGGPELLIKTLHDELGLTIHHYAVIKFEGFKSLIDRVGGVQVAVDGALKLDKRTGKLYRGNLDYDDNWGNLHIHLKPGMQTLDGEKAHAYARFRMDREGDPGRIRRQQQIMRALAKQMTTVPFWRLPGLIDELQKQFVTDMTTEQLASAATFAKNLGDTGKIQPLTLFGTYFEGGSICLNKPKNEKLLSYIFGPTFNAANFLRRSPWTRGDDIGPSNDANPGAIALLREAGLMDENGAVEISPALEAPVRDEGEREVVATRRAGRYAAANDTTAESSDEGRTPSRVRETGRETTRKTRRSRAKSSDEKSASTEPAPSPADEIIGNTPAREDSGLAREPAPADAPEPAPEASEPRNSEVPAADNGDTPKPE